MRSLALENNKWQTWARGQLSRIDPAASPATKDDVITSLENQLESVMKEEETDEYDDDDLFFDVYDEESEIDSETESVKLRR